MIGHSLGGKPRQQERQIVAIHSQYVQYSITIQKLSECVVDQSGGEGLTSGADLRLQHSTDNEQLLRIELVSSGVKHARMLSRTVLDKVTEVGLRIQEHKRKRSAMS